MMNRSTTLTIVLTGFFASAIPVFGQQQEAVPAEPVSTEDTAQMTNVEKWQADPTAIFESIGVDLAEFRFIARPVVVFADSPADPLFIEQMSLLQSDLAELQVRDVIIIVDTDPTARSSVRQELRPRGFGLVLIGKDGRVAQRKPSPVSVRELRRAIDKMPLRLQEIRDGNG